MNQENIVFSWKMQQATLRLCLIERPSTGSCGFHLSRTAWDPYPWVSGVECGSAADFAGLQPGDCVLEVNGEDVLGQRIGQVAAKVRAKDNSVNLLLWNAGATNISGNGSTPVSLQRLSNCLQSVLQLLECPVCLETIPPPASQCCNGHVLCGRCRSRADKCPVCRVSLGPRGRCLLADKLHNLLISVLNQNHKNKQLYKTSSNQIQQPIQVKSRITAEIFSPTNEDILLQTRPQHAGSSADSVDKNINYNSIQQPFHLKSRIAIDISSSNNTDILLQANLHNAEINASANSILIESKACSGENISFGSVPSVEQALNSPSMTTEQYPITLHPQPCADNQMQELSFHCPFPFKSTGHCTNVSIGSQALLKHLQDDHVGPLIQYFFKPSRSVVKLRLPLSSSRSPSSSLTSFTRDNNAVFFLQVAAGVTPGQRLVWLWLLGDSAQSDRYRLRLSLPEGDTHTGPVFPLTSSWNEVVNSNCCLSIKESRYNRANPEVRLEILDILNN